MATSSQTQLGAALALTQLLNEYPALPVARWRIASDGVLSGTVAADAEYDVRPMLRTFAEVLGGTLHETLFTSPNAGPSLSVDLYATWRDVEVTVWGSCVISAVAEGAAVAA